MTPFEQWSLVAYYLQLLLIGGGLWMMQKAGQRRDKQIDEISAALREQSAGIRALLERSA